MRLVALALLVAACAPADDTDADTDAVDTDTDAADDTDAGDTDTDDGEDTETKVVCADDGPVVDRLVELGGPTSSWSVVEIEAGWEVLVDSAPSIVEDLVPGQSVGFRLRLPGTLTFLRPADFYVFAQASEEDVGSYVAAAPADTTVTVSDLAGVPMLGEANNEWALRDAVGDDGFFYGTFVYAEDVPGGSDASCFGWVYTVPTSAVASESGTVSVDDGLDMTIHRIEFQISAATDGSGDVFAWTPDAP